MRRPVLAIVVLTSSAVAQSPATGSAVAQARAQWQAVHANIVRSAEQLPDSLYGFRPVATVRTFAQLFAHVAGSEFMFCAAARGEKDAEKHEADFEGKVHDRAGLVKALRDAATYCETAYAMSDATAAETVDLFGQRTKLNALIFNAVHDGEHYGNLVTYLRLKGLVPPSSQRQ